ncbi:Histidine kinase [Croceitalea dokdonensis DOKDO 023]|uniref:histidine kinase n=1 Tax=Croceitalea dokdonensis DOKDO 023 TaxID=1300341 RepID=A0A0P7AXK1_9FLAO|nr:tetratricopeptide repeat protein [Croceitalea dokdonensis]KPM32784.1 Histidine kinase [Croceitalea dokdonensis DOKDO 023]
MKLSSMEWTKLKMYLKLCNSSVLKRKPTLLFFLIITFCGFSQTTVIDSLKLQLKKKQQDTIKGEILGDLAYYYLYENIDSAITYGKKLERYAEKLNLAKFKVLANKNIGNAFIFSGKYDSAFVYLSKALRIAEINSLEKSALYTSIGVMYKRQNNYEKALQAYFQGVKYDEKTGNTYGEFIKLVNIGNLYNIKKDYDNAIKYNKRALLLSEKANNDNINFALGTLLNNIGTIYSKTDKIDTAIDYFEQSLKVNLKNENKKEVARNYNNLGVIYDRKGDYEKALNFLNKSLKISIQQGDENDLIQTHMSLGTTYGKTSNKVKSENHFNEALVLAKKIKSYPSISEIYLAISNIDSLKNQPVKALGSYKLHIRYKDSMLNETNEEIINEIETKYETEKKDKEIAEQKLALEKNELELQKKKTQYGIMTGIAIFLLVSSLLGWFLYQQRQKRKNQEILALKREQQVKTLESLMEGEEKERFRIAKELHDGVNGDLSAIKYKLTSMLAQNTVVINEVVAMIDKSSEQVRAISHNLVPPSLEKFNLVEALFDYCSTMDDLQKQKINFHHIGEHPRISKKNEANIYRIIQELVSNSIKHAEAKEITVQISSRENIIQVTVEDDGKGYDLNNVDSKGIGLNNIDSRIDYLNATKDVISNSKGTSYSIEIDTTNLNDN